MMMIYILIQFNDLSQYIWCEVTFNEFLEENCLDLLGLDLGHYLVVTYELID